MKKLSLIILGILIAAQFAVPFSMIQSRENILRNGDLFKFKTRPIDPADPFQGRYVRLAIDAYIKNRDDQPTPINARPKVYASIEPDVDGFAHFSEWSLEKPKGTKYLRTRIHYFPNNGIDIDIPFDRYYMDEAKAPRAEQLARESTRSTNCWVAVRILNGKAVIEDVFAEGQSLRILAEEEK